MAIFWYWFWCVTADFKILYYSQIVDDFKQVIQQDFQKSPVNLNIADSSSPVINQWIWNEQANSLLYPVWIAVMGGEMAGYQENGSVREIFYVSLTLFPFDMNTKKRLCLTTGENVLEFLFERKPDNSGSWRSLGWCMDEYGEWEDIEWE
ncbi:MAG: hypothetical protein SAJ12_24575 [Jaaginema sp. PMC 1079.18]|nr:hypothetical protein [Jaaginema sp. PMC 1080.18]MEC4854170.1 hypothetical protein [Jaaginema sp. PMC 1079.18]MEC4867573.1 hypothetical protein [Jaaginema sp. PMC 1078.18]